MTDANYWLERHEKAFRAVNGFIGTPTMERGWVAMYKAWRLYADAHLRETGRKIGDNGYAAEHWADMGKALLAFLNMETGRLDCGTCDKLVREVAVEHGLTEELEVSRG